ncbi:hypothetical protein ACNQGL_07630 [Flavobacterium sp. LB3P21]|uniref:hypothetical protein n=1 Tax=Flavobacterium sp. LB3P21 TaxID=3401719 RepID=UPI003AB0C4C7
MKVTIYNFPDHLKGDTFLAKQINFGINITDAIIAMQFKTTVNSPTSFFWSTVDNSITIIDPINGIVQINNKGLDFAPAKYIYDCQITFNNGIVKTFFGGSITIVQDITE